MEIPNRRCRCQGSGELFREIQNCFCLFLRLSVIFGSFACRCLLYLNKTGLHYNRAANESLMRPEDVFGLVSGM